MTRVDASTGTPRVTALRRSFPAYAALASAGFRRYATYRQATIAGAFTNSVFGFLRSYALLAAATGAGGVAAQYDKPRLATFVWVGQGMLATVQLWGSPELAERIRTGEVVADLLRPINPVWQQLASDIGRAGHAALVRFTLPVLVGALTFDLYAPRRLVTYPLFALSVVLAVLVCFGCKFVAYSSVYWLLDVRGPHMAWLLGSAVFSGLVFPLWFLPAGLATALVVGTPFPSIMQIPLDILVERGDPFGPLALQLAWAVAVLWLAQLVQRRGERKLVIQGG